MRDYELIFRMSIHVAMSDILKLWKRAT